MFGMSGRHAMGLGNLLLPGTADVALTVFQSLPVDGIVIVTSPQDLVSMIVAKAVNMAEKMNIPGLEILGRLPIDPALAAACDTGAIEDELPAGLLPDALAKVAGLPEHVEPTGSDDASA